MEKKKLYPLSQSWVDFPNIVNEELAKLDNDAVIVEIGGGANPYLTKEQTKGFYYIVIDISDEELTKANGEHFKKICADITKDNLNIECDLIITNMLLEHLLHPKAFHEACYKILKDNGKAVHFFATKYSPASVVNLILPEQWSRKLLYAFQNRKWETQGKFPAYYKWCIGPTKKQANRFVSLGFYIEGYYGYLGSGYLNSIKVLNLCEKIYNRVIIFLDNPNLCSNSIIKLVK